VTHSGVHRLWSTCSGPVAQAIAVGAQERPALMTFRPIVNCAGLDHNYQWRNMIRSPDCRPTSRWSTPRRCPPCRAARIRWREAADRGGLAVAGVGQVRELAVPVVGESLTCRLGLVTPDVRGAGQSAAGGHFPLGFGRQLELGPIGVRRSISKAMWTTGWSSRPRSEDFGPRGWFQQAPGVHVHHWLR